MTKRRIDVSKRLTKIVTAALICSIYGVSFCMPSVAWADTVTITSGTYTVSNNKSDTSYNLNGSDITFTVESTGAVNSITGSSSKVENNSIIIAGGKVQNTIYAGMTSGNGVATNNYVEVNNNGSVNSGIYGGRTNGGGDVASNQILIEKGTIGYRNSENTFLGFIYGGESYGNGTIIGNTVTLNEGEVGDIYGGLNNGTKSTGPVNSNSVIINSGKVHYSVYGGRTEGNGNVLNNYVEVDKGNVQYIYSGDANGNGNVSGNQVLIKDGSSIGYIDGGRSEFDGNVTNNQVQIIKSSVSGNIESGFSAGAGEVSGNSVTMENGTCGSVIIGGSSYSTGTVTDNIVKLKDSQTSTIYGGMSSSGGSGDVTKNNVEINNSSATIIYCGYTSGSGNVYDNQAIIEKGTINTVYGGYTYGTGAVKNNIVEFKSGKVGEITGGVSYSSESESEVQGNAVNISGGIVQNGVRGGFINGNGIISKNSVTINGGTVNGGVYAGYTNGNGKVTENKVLIENDSSTDDENTKVKVAGSIYAGYSSGSGDVSNNTVDSTDAEAGVIYGGNGGSGAVENNSVKINNTKASYIYGGTSSNGEVTGNKVEIDKGTIGYNDENGIFHAGIVYGGNVSVKNNVKGNSVVIKNSNAGAVYGGGITDLNNTDASEKNVENNTVNITSSTLSEIVAVAGGSLNGNGNIINNQVKLENVKVGFVSTDGNFVATYAFGGFGKNQLSGVVKNNSVEFIGGEAAIVYGGFNDENSNGTIQNNTVTIREGSFKVIYGGFTGGNGDVTDNQVTIEKGAVVSSIEGGCALGSGFVRGNTVVINDGEIGSVSGGVNESYSDSTGKVEGNDVIINGGFVQYNVLGGHSYGSDVQNNYVEINAGSVNGSVFGGSTNTGNVTGNTVSLKGVAIGGDVYGGYGTDGISEVVTGNTLILAKADNTVKGVVQNFETIKLAATTEFEDRKTVLAAKGFPANADETRAVLDITEAVKLEEATSGAMTILASDKENDFNALTLNYSGGKATLNETKPNQVVKEGTPTPSTENNVIINTSVGTHVVSLDAANNYKNVLYRIADCAKEVTFGEMAWDEGRDAAGTDFTFVSDADIDTSKLTFKDPGKIAANSSMKLLANATGLAAGKDAVHSQDFTQNTTNGVTLSGNLNGTVTRSTAGEVGYKATATTLSVDLAGWDMAKGEDNMTLSGWAKPTKMMVETDGMNVTGMNPGDKATILSSDTADFFKDAEIKGAKQWKEGGALNETDKGVTLTGNTTGSGVKSDDTNSSKLIYQEVKNTVNSVDIGEVTWETEAPLFDGSGVVYDYASVNAIGTDDFAVANPEAAARDVSVTLLKANATLAAIVNEEKTVTYNYMPVDGVTVAGNITGKFATGNNAVTFTPSSNQASKLTFGTVEWKDSGALMTRPANITFAGADIDTTKIGFTGVDSLEANQKMTLVSDFGSTVGTITGTKYTIGTALEGEGAASLSGSDLIFTTKTGSRNIAAQEQTHSVVMGMEANMATLAAGREHVDNVMNGLADSDNMGSDGTSTTASVGGEGSRYETGSHVSSHTWNAAVGIGRKRELDKGTIEYGIFGEYGKGNYTLHSDNGGRGDGSGYYAGGGLLARWTNKHNVYTEASFRLGRVSDSASNILEDAAGNRYGYNVHANYFGVHVGVGKIMNYKGGKALDVYGKYFYTKRNGVSFDAGADHYDLDGVSSSLLRIGARYGSTDKKWNWYGGLAYEYEFDGKSGGTVTTAGISAPIRAASIKGSSVRGEIGIRMSATKTNPWQTDISIYGYGGKHRGFGGSVNVAYMF